MYPSPFEYHRPSSVGDALALMAEFGDEGKVIAGGHSLLPIMKLRFATPRHLIDIGRIAGMSGVSESGGALRIGALTPHADVAASVLVRDNASLLADAAASIGDVQVRNRGTIGGSLAHADPGADLPAALLALGGSVVAVGTGGERVIAADALFSEAFTTALAPGELLIEIRIPAAAPGTRGAYVKHADPASGYAIVGIASLVTVAGSTITSARVAMTGLAPHAMRLTGAEQALTGAPATAESAQRAAARAGEGVELFDDPRGSAKYKANLARIFVGRAVAAALASPAR